MTTGTHHDTQGRLVNVTSSGQIGLLEFQHPVEWSNAKVRDLFESLYRGWPPITA